MTNQSNFKILNELYKQGNFTKILSYSNGLYFLKLCSISRPHILKEFAKIHNIPVTKASLKHIFEKNISESTIDKFIADKSISELKIRIDGRDELYTELFKMDVLDWGGLYQNGLEKTIVNNYVKKIKNYEELNKKINDELHNSMSGYVKSSWYNNWSTILIESMFMEHLDVLPAIGYVKYLDFFWKNIPLDLKVTYFPNEFLNDKRREKHLGTELSSLKKFANANGVYYNKNSRDKSIFVELSKKFSESHDEKETKYWNEFKKNRINIINHSINHPEQLARWLYENQGERRFDRAYRFYLILIDTKNFEESWKLKRSRDIVPDKIKQFLSKNPKYEIMDISFEWKGVTYETKCFVLFVVI